MPALLATLTSLDLVAFVVVILVLYVIVSRILEIVPADARQAEERARRNADRAFRPPPDR